MTAWLVLTEVALDPMQDPVLYSLIILGMEDWSCEPDFINRANKESYVICC